jgi:CubicO group peptidase (beta-lactamase class C family)
MLQMRGGKNPFLTSFLRPLTGASALRRGKILITDLSMSIQKFHWPSRLLAVTLILFPAMGAFAQQASRKGGKAPVARPARAESIADGILTPAIQQKKLVGVAAAVVCGGRTLVNKGYGVTSHESNTPPDENTSFYIQSLSKGITAVGAMLLLDEGKLKLDAPASKYLKGLPKSWQPITIAQFMSHSSGIPDLSKKAPTFEEMLQAAANEPLQFKPGSQQKYNNFNFAVIGKVIEAISGMSYLDFMKQRVFAPLHMDSSGAHLQSANAAVSYNPQGKPIAHRIPGGDYAIPSGHLQMTLSDLLKLHAALENGSFLKPAGLHALVTRVYADRSGTAGWFEESNQGVSVVSKNGGGEGFHSMFSFVPGKGDAAILLWTSSQASDNSLAPEAAQLLSAVCGVPTKGTADTGDGGN